MALDKGSKSIQEIKVEISLDHQVESLFCLNLHFFFNLIPGRLHPLSVDKKDESGQALRLVNQLLPENVNAGGEVLPNCELKHPPPPGWQERRFLKPILYTHLSSSSSGQAGEEVLKCSSVKGVSSIRCAGRQENEAV